MGSEGVGREPALVRLACLRCGSRLTRPCREGAEAHYDRRAQRRAPAVPAGWLVRLAGAERVTITEGLAERHIGRRRVSDARAFVLNPKDVLPGAIVSSGIDNGCCGSDGCDGPNRSCGNCGLVLGTEWSDCWTQAEVRLEAAAVVVTSECRSAE